MIGQEFPRLEVVASIEGQDDPDLIAQMLPKVFANAPNICGVYSSAGGNGGLVSYLEGAKKDDLVIIAHELTPRNRTALIDGTFDALISQNSGHLVRSAVRLLRATADNAPFNATQEHIRSDIYLKDNVPSADPGSMGGDT